MHIGVTIANHGWNNRTTKPYQRISYSVQFNYPLQCFLNDDFRNLGLDPVSCARDHDCSNVRVRCDVFDGAQFIDRWICDHDCHSPLVWYCVEGIEKVPLSVLLSGRSRFKLERLHRERLTLNMPCTASAEHRRVPSSL